ncbi:arginine-binding periplasmic protein 1 [Aggregatibacter aphrophilus NJ8700]|nr:arginine-binding periplasmic protein 1 [Aggregatibacter aphrophilus NJ8700]
MKTVLISSFLMGLVATASAQNLTFGTEPSYPPFESTTEKGVGGV